MKFLFICLGVFGCVEGAMQSSSPLMNCTAPTNFPTTIQENSLLSYANSKYSQWGEEGIVGEILKRMQIQNGFFVEFGGADGILFSNTRALAEKGWQGVFIEASKPLFTKAVQNCRTLPKVTCINEFVTWDTKDPRGKTFDQIADNFFVNKEIDVLSIDIDGADYQILETLKRKPKVIIIEGGLSWSPYLTKRIPDSVAHQNLQQPLHVVFEIAKTQGYTPVCVTNNSILVRNDFSSLFKEIKNDPVTLWFDFYIYLNIHKPGVANYIRNLRATNLLIRQFDTLYIP